MGKVYENGGDRVSMNTLIICTSVHHKNTRKIAEAMADALHADLMAAGDVTPEMCRGYDLVGFGSGIYFGSHHKTVTDLAAQMAPAPGARTFIFSTAALPLLKARWHRKLRRILQAKGYKIAGEFCCRGYDTYGPCGWIGGIHRGRPDAQDIANAKEFAETLKTLI